MAGDSPRARLAGGRLAAHARRLRQPAASPSDVERRRFDAVGHARPAGDRGQRRGRIDPLHDQEPGVDRNLRSHPRRRHDVGHAGAREQRRPEPVEELVVGTAHPAEAIGSGAAARVRPDCLSPPVLGANRAGRCGSGRATPSTRRPSTPAAPTRRASRASSAAIPQTGPFYVETAHARRRRSSSTSIGFA